MAKFKMRMKLTGFEVEIEGERDDIPRIASGLNTQLAGLIAGPAKMAVESPPPKPVDVTVSEPVAPSKNKARRSRRPRRPAADTKSEESDSQDTALDWRHDPERWGSPRQDWKVWQKAVWLLLVVRHERDVKEMSCTVISKTFVQHFREAGPLRANLVQKFLMAAKQEKPALVGEATERKPSGWFLTAEGLKAGAKLVAEAGGTFCVETAEAAA